MMQPYERDVDEHYKPGSLDEKILQGLKAMSLNLESLVPENLYSVDHFHIGGAEMTTKLARLASITPNDKILDVGGGLAGTARFLAKEFGSQVTVVDLSDEFCRVAEMLNKLTKLNDKITIKKANALRLPFEPSSFDIVWTQHCNMNIEDKELLFKEFFRVLRNGGQYVFHEIMAGPITPIHFPVPWARQASLSFLKMPEEIKNLLNKAGFQQIAWVDETEASREWFRSRLPAPRTPPAPPPPLGLHLILGNDFQPMFKNVSRNLEEDRITVNMAVYQKP